MATTEPHQSFEVQSNDDEEEEQVQSSNDEEDDNSDSNKPPSKTESVGDHELEDANDNSEHVTSPVSAKAKPAKRPFEGNKTESKGKKKKIDGAGEKPKKWFQRLWSEEDELVILKSLSHNKKQGEEVTASNLPDFLNNIQGHLSIDVNRDQLGNKIRKMKGKFLKGKSTFTKRPESFELMEELWGSQGVNIDGDGGGGSSSKNHPKRSVEEMTSLYPSLMRESINLSNGNNGVSLMLERVCSFSDRKATKFEKYWKEVTEAELDAFRKRTAVQKQQLKEVSKRPKSLDS